MPTSSKNWTNHVNEPKARGNPMTVNYSKRIIIVREADLCDFFFVDFRRANVCLFHVQ